MEERKLAKAYNWTPLEKAVPPALLGDFMHMGEVGTIQQYKHRDTRRYLYIDADCTRFYGLVGASVDNEFVEIDRGAALRYALEMCYWADPGAPLDRPEQGLNALPVGFASESLRAAGLLNAFLEIQCAVEWWLLDELDEAWETILVFSYLNDEMRGLARLITDQLNGHNQYSFERRAREIQGIIEVLKVPAAWLPQPGESDPLPAPLVRAWQSFCELVATETGRAPCYGVARPEEPSLMQEPSLAEPGSEHELPPEAMDISDELSLVSPVITAQERAGFWRRFREMLGV